MTSAYALPVSNPLPSGDNSTGTMFLGRTDRLYAFGAAHSPTMGQPHSRWQEWPPSIFINNSLTTNLRVELFESLVVGRLPHFRYERQAPGHQMLNDMMAVNANPTKFPGTPVVDLTKTIERPSVGATISVSGYPFRPALGRWPYAPAMVAAGTVIENTDTLIMANMPSAIEGFSGGPVFANDQFVGMFIGYEDDGVRRIVPASALQRLVGWAGSDIKLSNTPADPDG